jgi:hypothetical protein
MKKIAVLGAVIGSIVLMTGCSSFFKSKNSGVTLSQRGMQYYFDNEIYSTVSIDILENIQIYAPSMEGLIKDNLRIYRGENNALVLWLDKAKNNSVSLDRIINKYSEAMVDNIEDVAQIDDVGVELNMELLAKDTVNDITRNKYKGTINAIGRDGIDVELNTVLYTLKIGGRPGYIMGIVTNRAQNRDEFVEIETNAQIMANTIRNRER